MAEKGSSGSDADFSAVLPAGEQELLRRVREIAAEYGPEFFRRMSQLGIVKHDLWNRLAREGLLGLHLPQEVGGGGQGLQSLAAVLQATAEEGVPLTPGIFSSAVAALILRDHGDAEQRRRWLGPIASGQGLCAFAMTEVDAGLNTFRTATTARRESSGDWVLNGEKSYVTAVDQADWIMVIARTGDDSGKRPELSLFVIDRDSPGLSIAQFETELNVPERSSVLTLDEVHVPADRLVGRPGGGMKAAFSGMNAERILAGVISTGIGRFALRRAVRRAATRTVWTSPIGVHQAVSHPLARAHIALDSASLVARQALCTYDSGNDASHWANIAKFTGAAAGLEAVDAAIRVYGGAGVISDEYLAGYWFLLRSYQLGPVSDEMALNFVAEQVLGLPRSY